MPRLRALAGPEVILSLRRKAVTALAVVDPAGSIPVLERLATVEPERAVSAVLESGDPGLMRWWASRGVDGPWVVPRRYLRRGDAQVLFRVAMDRARTMDREVRIGLLNLAIATGGISVADIDAVLADTRTHPKMRLPLLRHRAAAAAPGFPMEVLAAEMEAISAATEHDLWAADHVQAVGRSAQGGDLAAMTAVGRTGAVRGQRAAWALLAGLGDAEGLLAMEPPAGDPAHGLWLQQVAWSRTATAAQELLRRSRRDPAAVDPAGLVLCRTPDAEARVRELALSPGPSGQPVPGWRASAIFELGRTSSGPLKDAAMQALLADPDPEVRMRAMQTGALVAGHVPVVLDSIRAATPALVVSALQVFTYEYIEDPLPRPVGEAVLEELVDMIAGVRARTRPPQVQRAVVEALTPRVESDPLMAEGLAFRTFRRSPDARTGQPVWRYAGRRIDAGVRQRILLALRRGGVQEPRPILGNVQGIGLGDPLLYSAGSPNLAMRNWQDGTGPATWRGLWLDLHESQGRTMPLGDLLDVITSTLGATWSLDPRVDRSRPVRIRQANNTAGEVLDQALQGTGIRGRDLGGVWALGPEAAPTAPQALQDF